MVRDLPPSAVVRTLSDEAVLRALMDGSRLTRAQLATQTGLSKPTAAEAIRRLEAAGLVHDTGERTSGRGGVGTFYALTDEAGIALVVSIAPDGIVAETVDSAGLVRDHVQVPVRRPATPKAVTQLVKRAARNILAGEPARIAVVSAADPVDRGSGELIQLPDAPFLVGAMSPVKALQPFVVGRVIVDNDVNWAARAELVERRVEQPDLADFAYIYLGEGLGCAVIADGEVRRGHRGIAGEIAHVVVPGPDGSAIAFTEVFARLGLRRPQVPAIDVEKLAGVLDGRRGTRVADDLARAIWGVITAAIAFHDPELVVIGGTWGTHDRVLESLRRGAGEQPRTVAIDRARALDQAPLTGARAAAVDALRADILARIG